MTAKWLLKDPSDNFVGLRLWCHQDPMPVLDFVATEAFPNMTDVWLGRLIRHLCISPVAGGPNPRTVLGKVEMLVRAICPNISDEHVRLIMLKRGADKQVDKALLMPQGSESVAGKLLEPADQGVHHKSKLGQGDVGNELKKVKEYLSSRSLDPEATADGSRSLASGSSAAAVSKRRRSSAAASSSGPRLVDRPAHVQAARDLLPIGVKGVILQPYPATRRYQVYYPTSPGFKKSACFTFAGPGRVGFTEGQVLQAAVSWAWEQHTREQSVVQPFEWADINR